MRRPAEGHLGPRTVNIDPTNAMGSIFIIQKPRWPFNSLPAAFLLVHSSPPFFSLYSYLVEVKPRRPWRPFECFNSPLVATTSVFTILPFLPFLSLPPSLFSFLVLPLPRILFHVDLGLIWSNTGVY